MRCPECGCENHYDCGCLRRLEEARGSHQVRQLKGHYTLEPLVPASGEQLAAEAVDWLNSSAGRYAQLRARRTP